MTGIREAGRGTREGEREEDWWLVEDEDEEEVSLELAGGGEGWLRDGGGVGVSGKVLAFRAFVVFAVGTCL